MVSDAAGASVQDKVSPAPGHDGHKPQSFRALVLGSIGDRQGRRGGAIVVAALAGVGFQMFNQTFGTFAVVYRVPPLLGAVAPGVLALLAGLWAFRRLR